MKQYSLVLIVYILVWTECSLVQSQGANQTTTSTPTNTTRFKRPWTHNRTTAFTRKTTPVLIRHNSTVFQISHPPNTTTASNEREYVVVKSPTEAHNNVSAQESVKKDGSNETSTVPPLVNKLSFLDHFKQLDRYELIMVTAFFVGLFFMALLVILVICIYKKISDKNSTDEALSNPIYDVQVKSNGSKSLIYKVPLDFLEGEELIKPDLVPSPGDRKPLLDSNPPNSENIEMKPIDSKPTSNESFVSRSTSSVSSVDSKALKSPSTPGNIDKSNRDETSPFLPANTETDSGPARFTPSHANKTQQQLIKEGVNSASRRSLLNRRSETADERPKRISVASSASSIQNINIDFATAKDGVEQCIKNIEDEKAYRQRPSASVTHSQSSIAKSTTSLQIYIDALEEKRQAMKKPVNHGKLRTQVSNLSSDTTASSIGNEKATTVSNRRSTGALNKGVSTNPGGGGSSGRALNQTRSDSVNTLESEKSCY